MGWEETTYCPTFIMCGHNIKKNWSVVKHAIYICMYILKICML